MRSLLPNVFLLFTLGLLPGCAKYVTPGRGMPLSEMSPEMRESLTDVGVSTVLGRKPLAAFPTGIAVVRVQEPCYRSRTAESYGQGKYSVVTTRDVETDDEVRRLEKLPRVSGVAPLNRLLLPRDLDSDVPLRRAAASLHADMLLIYTIDTTFYVQDMLLPLSVVTLGLSPNQNARVVTTASAALVDTRNGYVYAVAEATERSEQLASAWTSDSAVDQCRLKTETKAFDQLVTRLESAWTDVVRQYARRN